MYKPLVITGFTRGSLFCKTSEKFFYFNTAFHFINVGRLTPRIFAASFAVILPSECKSITSRKVFGNFLGFLPS